MFPSRLPVKLLQSEQVWSGPAHRSLAAEEGSRNGRALRPKRVAVAGTGPVGSDLAYALLLHSLVDELVLVDGEQEQAADKARDLHRAAAFSSPAQIWAGDYAACAEAEVVILAGDAGPPGLAAGPEGQRLQHDAVRVRAISRGLAEHNFGGVLLVAKDPVEVMTQLAWQESGLPAKRVIGLGTVLDTARFRYALAQQLGIEARAVHAHVIGGHTNGARAGGERLAVPVWSMASVDGIGLESYCRRIGYELDAGQREQILARTWDGGQQAGEAGEVRQGMADYATSTGLLRIVQSILRNQYRVWAVSTLVPGSYGIDDVFLSLPAVISRAGVEQVLHLPLNAEETQCLKNSAAALRGLLATLSQV